MLLAGLFVLFAAFGVPLAAQDNPDANEPADSQLAGIVRTPDGTAVPGSTLRVIQTSTGKAWVTWTDQNGEFEFPALPAGHYRVEISQLGFAPATKEIDLASGKQAPVDLKLDVGTLAAITSVNFKLAPIPDVQRTMLLGVDSPAAAFEIRDKVIRSALQPWAIDFISLRAATELGFKKALLAVEFGGNLAVIERCSSEIAQWGEAVELTEEEAGRFWIRIHDFTPMFLKKFTGGVMLRVSTTLSDMCEAVDSLGGPVIARAASGVIYAHFSLPYSAAKWMAANPKWTSVIEYAPAAQKDELVLWPSAGKQIELMKRVKEMFDPHNLLNRGRYYRHF